MADTHNVLGLEISEEDVEFLHKEWRFQRIGWIAMAMVVLAAFTGAFGHGPIAREQVGDPRIFAVDFDRIIRHGSDTDIEVTIGPGLQPDSIIRIGFSRSYLEAFDVNGVTPEPNAHGEYGDVVYFDFTRGDRRLPAHIEFHLHPNKYWHRSAVISLAGATDLKFGQVILP